MAASRRRAAVVLTLSGLTVLAAAAPQLPIEARGPAAASPPASLSLSAVLGGGRALRPEVQRPDETAYGDPRAASVAHLDPPTRAQLHERAYAQALARPAAAPATGARWVERGPTPIDYTEPYEMGFTGWGSAGGRIVALAVDPRDASGDTVYAGTSAGGLWRSTDAGRRWTPLFQDQSSLAVGAVAVDPTTGTLHVGTGEMNFNSAATLGTGVYRSTDGGRTWRRATGVPAGTQVSALALGRPGTVFAATDRGLYASSDGGASYVDVELPTNAEGTAPYAEGTLGSVVTDVVVKPDDPDEVTAAVGWVGGRRTDPVTKKPQSVGNGLYRSSEGGLAGTWSRLEAPTFGRGTTSGDPIGRTTLAYAEGAGQDHDVLWALVHDAASFSGKSVLDAPLATSTSVLNGVYRSADNGATWDLEADASVLSHAEGSVYADPVLFAVWGVGAQAWFNQHLAVDPTNEDRVFVGLEEVFQTVGDPAQPGPAQWRAIARYWGGCKGVYAIVLYECIPGTDTEGRPTPHPDHHAVALAVTPDGVRLYDGGDGGLSVQDVHDGGFDNDSWQTRNEGMGVAKPYYSVMGRDGQILTGLQDNGTVLIAPGAIRGVNVHGGDGGAVAIDPGDPDVMYAEYQGGGFAATTDRGETWTYAPPPDGYFAFIPPFTLDDAIADHLVMAGSIVYATENGPLTKTNDWVPVFDLGAGSPTNGVVSAVPVATAVDLHDAAAYVTWCKTCYPPFSPAAMARSGLATNVTRDCERAPTVTECWRHAAGAGLPSRLLTDVAIDRRDERTIVVTAGGYVVRWFDPRDGTTGVGRGHVYLSRDAGESFRDISAGLPDVPANSVVLRGDEVYVGTDVGVFRAARPGAPFERFGTALPLSPVYDVTLNPQRDTLVASTHGRGVWTLSLGASRDAPPLPAPRPGRPPVVATPRPLPATGADPRLVVVGLALLGAAVVVRRGRLSAVEVRRRP